MHRWLRVPLPRSRSAIQAGYAAALALLLTGGCGHGPSQAPAPGENKETAMTRVAAQPEAYYIEVNGVRLSQRDVDAFVAEELARKGLQDAPPPIKQAIGMSFATNAVENFIREVIMLTEADSRGIRVEEADIDAAVEELKATTPAGSTFEAALRARNLTEDQLRDNPQLIIQIKIRKLLNRQLADLDDPSDEEIARVYQDQPQFRMQPARVHLRHLMIRCAPDADKTNINQKLTLAVTTRERLISGADFAELATKLSDGPSARFGGDMGWMPESDIEAVLGAGVVDAANRQPIDHIGGILRTSLGFNIIQVLGREPAVTNTVEDVRDEIAEQIMHDRRKTAIEQFYAGLRSTARIRYPATQP